MAFCIGSGMELNQNKTKFMVNNGDVADKTTMKISDVAEPSFYKRLKKIRIYVMTFVLKDEMKDICAGSVVFIVLLFCRA